MKILDLLTSQPDDFKFLLDLDPSAPIFKALENLQQTVDDKNILFILKDICSKQMPVEKAENLIKALFSASQTLNKSPEDYWMLQTVVNTINNEQLASIGIAKEKNQPVDIIAFLMSLFLSYPIFLNENNSPCLYPLDHFTHFTPTLPEEGLTISEMLLSLSTKQKETLLAKLKDIDPLKITHILINQETGVKTKISAFNPNILKYDTDGKILSSELFAGEQENLPPLWENLLILINTTLVEKGLQISLSLPAFTRVPLSWGVSSYKTRKNLENQNKDKFDMSSTQQWNEFKERFTSINLTAEEHQTIFALFTLYTKNSSPTFLCNLTDICKAAGYDSKTSKWVRSRIEKRIEELKYKTFDIFYQSPDGKTNEKKPQTKFKWKIVTTPLFILEEIKDIKEAMTEREFYNLYPNLRMHKKLLRFTLNVNLFKDNFFSLADVNYFTKLKTLKPGRINSFYPNFYFWLIMQKNEKIERNRQSIALDILKMTPTTVSRNPKYMNQTIEDVYKTHIDLGVLEKVELHLPAVAGGFKDVLYKKKITKNTKLLENK